MFVSIDLQPPAAEAVVGLLERLQAACPQVRWVPRQQLHVTLKFLGDVDNRLVPEICSRVRQACQPCLPFRVGLRQLGTFPTGRTPRVVWLGVDLGQDEFRDIHGKLDEALTDMDIPREGRRYTPHVTLGRVGKSADADCLQHVLERGDLATSTEFDVDQVLVMASIRRRGQVDHNVLDRISLAGG